MAIGIGFVSGDGEVLLFVALGVRGDNTIFDKMLVEEGAGCGGVELLVLWFWFCVVFTLALASTPPKNLLQQLACVYVSNILGKYAVLFITSGCLEVLHWGK
jgi:hypothetical protein